ncbi:MAG TPA: hypothetical protein VHV30_17845 [Polyangiaceae bacterium]|nr:hypothetical protein [Polyangiaceae bacterium]
MDSLPPPPPPVVAAEALAAPGDLYPRDSRERDLCSQADHPDWLYLGGLAFLDVATVYFGDDIALKYSPHALLRELGPLTIGFAWGATLGGGYLALPKCSFEWIGESPREGRERPAWPLALSIALVAGATAPVVTQIAIGGCSTDSSNPNSTPCQQGYIAATSTEERAVHLIIAGVAGFGGALLPYVFPPQTYAAARELDKIRVGADPHGAFLGYVTAF